jgi:hypothetical protein
VGQGLLIIGDTQSHTDTSLGRTPLDEWSAQHIDLYLTTHNTHKRQNIHVPGGIRTDNPSKWDAADCAVLESAYKIINTHTHTHICTHSRSQDRVVSTAARLRDGRGSNRNRRKKRFSSTQSSDWLWGPARLLFNGHQIYFLGQDRPGREYDHSLLSSAKVKN